jgi:hypothetical protein
MQKHLAFFRISSTVFQTLVLSWSTLAQSPRPAVSQDQVQNRQRVPCSEEYHRGARLANSNGYDAGIPVWILAAKAGDVCAQRELGSAYSNGNGTIKGTL